MGERGHGLEYVLAPLEVPAAFGQVLPVEITNNGAVLGRLVDNQLFGVVFYKQGPRAFTIPGATAIDLGGMSNGGTIVGNYYDANGNYVPFRRSPQGKVTPLVVPGTWFFVQAADISDSGTVVGVAAVSPDGPAYGFVQDRTGSRLLSIPGARYVSPTGVNNAGTVVGFTQDDQFALSTFVVDRAGQVGTIVIPGASFFTFPNAINNHGVIVGEYGDDAGSFHGFVLDHGTLTVIDRDAPSTIVYEDPSTGTSMVLSLLSQGTSVSGINDRNEICGTVDATYTNTERTVFVERWFPFTGRPRHGR